MPADSPSQQPEGVPAGADPTRQWRPHDAKVPPALLEFMGRDWAPSPAVGGDRHPAVEQFARRRAALSQRLPGRHLVIPTGPLKVRANDTHHNFRPGTEFYWLTGQRESDCVLVMRAEGDSHRPVLYVTPRADRTTREYFTNARSGELWVGPRRGVEETAEHLGIECAPLTRLRDDLAALGDGAVALRGIDPAVDSVVPRSGDFVPERQLMAALSEMRLVKDDYEVRELEKAVAATVRGFEDVVRSLPEAMEQGERVIEGVFNLRARVDGNDPGYGTIAASGAHATVLHWTRNDGEVRPGDLLLLDAGVEGRELYTADVTRTLPVSGRFSPVQRRLYELVLRAQRAGIAAVRPGAKFTDPHNAAMRVITEGLAELGIIDDVEAALDDERQLYRRYTLHGTSHMLGMDVHDCAQARHEHYRGGPLEPGYALTVEPGLYFQVDDLTVPEELRGIGIRIEDDVLVTEDGCRVLSDALPTDPDEIERWMAGLRRSDLELRRPLSG